CTLETPSCTLTNDSPKYTGQNVTFTGNTNSRAKITDINFGNGNGVGISANSSTYITTYAYLNSGIYTAILTTTSNITGFGIAVKTGTCNTSVTILANTGAVCGNNILEGIEQCDNGNITAGDGCSATCTLETPSCVLTATPITGYAPLSVLFSGTKNSRANYTLIFGTGSSTGTFNLPLTNIYSSTGTFIYSLTGTSTLSGAFTCIQTGTITSLYSGMVCRNGWINQSGTCLLIGTGNTITTGTVTSGTIFYIPGNIIIYSSGNNTGGYIEFSGINYIGISYGNRDGILIPPTVLTAGSCSAPTNVLTSISSGLTNPVTLLEFQAGASGSTITSNITGGYFTIKVQVNSGTIGNAYRIFRSAQCGTGREKVYIDELCVLDANKMCEFRTNKLSYFNIISNISLGVGTPMIVGTIPRLRNAQIDKAYMSDPFTIANFNDTTLATITKGMLYVNGVAIGTSGYVQNGDELNIELYSSKKYDTTISSKITVGSVSATFYITTMIEGDDNNNYLSNLQKIRIMSIFNLLIELYSDNPSKETEFLYTLRSMLMDKLDALDENDDAYSTFEYLLSLIDARLLVSGIDESDYIAANCKEYEITFEEDERAYYSPDFKKTQYFFTRESLVRYIDSKNPGDCRINTYGSDYIDTRNTDSEKHVAPNGKVYKIEDNNDGYTSPDLSNTKYFDTLQGLRAYLNINNPATTIWNHALDTSFNSINHIAPNGKIYKIYKTDKGYMSYKLIKIRYFSTLDSIKSFINNNNKI
ncbi:MAG: myxococcus cysteine-rich repeat containing protein, partial [Candidatus Absconditicoccaceae bacterium]